MSVYIYEYWLFSCHRFHFCYCYLIDEFQNWFKIRWLSISIISVARVKLIFNIIVQCFESQIHRIWFSFKHVDILNCEKVYILIYTVFFSPSKYLNLAVIILVFLVPFYFKIYRLIYFMNSIFSKVPVYEILIWKSSKFLILRSQWTLLYLTKVK